MTITRRQTLIGAAATVAAAALPASKMKLVEGMSGEAVVGPEIEIVVSNVAGVVVARGMWLTHEIIWQAEKAMILDGAVFVKVAGETKRFRMTGPPQMSNINKRALKKILADTEGV
jgi:hypothetical protein